MFVGIFGHFEIFRGLLLVFSPIALFLLRYFRDTFHVHVKFQSFWAIFVFFGIPMYHHVSVKKLTYFRNLWELHRNPENLGFLSNSYVICQSQPQTIQRSFWSSTNPSSNYALKLNLKNVKFLNSMHETYHPIRTLDKWVNEEKFIERYISGSKDLRTLFF